MNRRSLLKLTAGAALSLPTATLSAAPPKHPADPSANVEQWDFHELSVPGPSTGNPFKDTTFIARFTLGHRTVEVPGFYDGEGIYRARFMPDTPGLWTWETDSNTPELRNHRGSFTCTPPSPANHGPVHVARQFHFEYADGTPFFPFGTTCYSCAFMGEPYEQQTLETLRTAGFNKVRLCLLPKPQGAGHELFALPFPRTSEGNNDLSRLNPAYFQHVERRILDLGKLGIQADVILFHPYDAWGYKSMPPESDDLYLRYAIARLSAFRNVWWSIANEYDLIKTKTLKDWDRFFHIIQTSDPYSRLRSIHHSHTQYDNSKPWVTHASLQEYDFSKSALYRAAWQKPILWDELQYEGNISRRWGNLSPEEMTRRFWLATVAGTYATHGETYISTDGSPVWSDGGKLHGTSAPRIAWLRALLERVAPHGLNEFEGSYYLSAGHPGQLYLYYFDMHSVGEYDFPLAPGVSYKCTLIDPWNMTATELPGTFATKGKGRSEDGEENKGASTHIKLSGKPYMAALFQKV